MSRSKSMSTGDHISEIWAKPTPPEPSKEPTLTSDEPIGILLVDDEAKNLMVLESILAKPEYKLVRAETVEEALLALIHEEFALLVLDIQMPVMSGFELAAMVKQRRKTANLPIIFLTAHFSEDQHILDGYGAGAVDYLHKPVNATILRSKVAVFAELYRRNRESIAANQALIAEIAERKFVESQLQELNNQLETRVRNRTAELQSINQALVESELKLTDANKLKDQFLAMLGHELRNPLAPIRNVVNILRDARTDPTQLNWCCDIIDRQATQLTRIIDDLLDVSRISRGIIQIEKSDVDLRLAVRQAIESCRPLIESRAQSLDIDLPAEIVWGHGNIARLTQVVSNLIQNAAKFSEPASTVHVRLEVVEPDRDQAIIRVRDHGRGFDPATKEQLFELFYQCDSSLDRNEGGMGIGLAVVKRITDLHGGTVDAHSDGPNKGSEFIVRLPCIKDPPLGESRTAPPKSAERISARILIVDDNQDLLTSLSVLLQFGGHEVRQASDGIQAIEMALAHRPQVIVMDIGLPSINGHDVCRKLRKEGMTDTLMIAMTGYGQERDRENSLSAGFDAHLVKPIDVNEIQLLLEDHFAHAQTP